MVTLSIFTHRVNLAGPVTERAPVDTISYTFDSKVYIAGTGQASGVNYCGCCNLKKYSLIHQAQDAAIVADIRDGFSLVVILSAFERPFFQNFPLVVIYVRMTINY